MHARETTNIRELTSAELDAVSGGGVKSSSVINTHALTLPPPAYPPITK
jgi:hypothetical protein